jgi:gag-polypeptide of LTR copia-type
MPAYGRCASAKDVVGVWETLQTQYGAQSDARVILFEHQLSQLKKASDTPMRKHADDFSELVDRIQYHLPLEAKWSKETINQKFFGTLDLQVWGPWMHSYGASLKTMSPSACTNHPR